MMPAHAAIAQRPLVFSASTNLRQRHCSVKRPSRLVVLTIVKAQGRGSRSKRGGGS